MSIYQSFPSAGKVLTKIIIAALLLALSRLSYADCKSSTEQLIKALHYYPGSESVEWGIFSECKVWPADSTKTIAVLVDPHKTHNDDDEHYDLEVLVLETSSGNVLRSLFQKDALITDAIPLASVQLDTARYLVAPGVIAFGVRSNRHGRYDEDVQDINLYAIQENQLKQILGNLVMRESILGVNDGMNAHNCRLIDISRTLAIAKTSSHGYADLIVQEKKSERDDGSTEDCTDAKTHTFSSQYLLHFDGSGYALPRELQDE